MKCPSPGPWTVTLPANTDADKREFIADVSAFANGMGGDIVFGLGERKDAEGKSTGTPELVGLDASINTDQTAQWIQNVISTGLKPRLSGFQTQFVKMTDDKWICVLRIPKSWSAPHMVTFKTTPAFYARTSSGKQPLEPHEIKNAFLGAENVRERITEFRSGRLGRLLSGDYPHTKMSASLVVLHTFPIAAVQEQRTVDLQRVNQEFQSLRPLYSTIAINNRYNLDGMLIHGSDGVGQTLHYLQLYRDGRIETAEGTLLQERGQHGRRIPFIALERELIAATQRYIDFYKKYEITPPVVLMVSLLGAKGGHIILDPYGDLGSRHDAIKQDHVLLPEIIVGDFDTPADILLQPVFDLIWNACGWDKCRSYGPDMRWRAIKA